MKNTFFRSILCAALLFCGGITAYIQAQSSTTEGTEFWVALTKLDSPDGAKDSEYHPLIAISAKEACHISITNPNTTWSGVEIDVAAGSWTEIKTGNGANQIPADQWFSLATASGTTQNRGLCVKSTKNVSVYVASRMEYSFDATNILPITALSDNYIIQDYPPHDFGSTFTILATENNTIIDINLTTPTGGDTKKVLTLNKGQMVQYVSDDKTASFTGTSVVARDEKKIALFEGAVFTQVPGGKSARDCLYEQAMPTIFWGTEFVVTRTMDRDADRVRITALNNDDTVRINGQMVKILMAGETFELELSENDLSSDAVKKMLHPYDLLLSGTNAHYIETSCPAAVYLYTVSSAYKKDASNEIGDPSMVWISPVEQMIKEITFGALATEKTKNHYVNIVTTTDNVTSMQLLNNQDQNILSASDFQPVLGNPNYSYARKLLLENQIIGQTFTLKGKKGFIAHVYGSGEDESYAYSVGSSAVERSIIIDNNILSDGDSLTICLGQPIEFATNFSAYDVDQITWDMGDGITNTYYEDAKYNYTYDTKGWYDIIVTYSLTNRCTGIAVTNEAMAVKLYVNIPDTNRVNKYLCEGDAFNGKTYNTAGTYIDTVYNDCVSVDITTIVVGKPSYETLSLTAFDSVFVQGDKDNPDMYVYEDAAILRHYLNMGECDSTVEMNIHVVHCTELAISYDTVACGGDTLNIAYTLLKGDMPYRGDFVAGNQTYGIRILQETTTTGVIQVVNIKPGYYTNSRLRLQDPNCDRTYELSVPLTVNFPSDIVAQKWNNVLAVYNAKKNGGYEFVSYQWFMNDSLLAGENSSIYYVGTDNELNFNACYYVLLTTIDGISLPSCPICPKDKYASDSTVVPTNPDEFTVTDDEPDATTENTEPTPDDTAAEVAVSPSIVNAGDNILIDSELDGRAAMYDITGQYQTEVELGRYTIMRAPSRAGVYVMHITLSDNTKRAFRVIVK